jgi:hypothetical protein
LLHYSRKCSVWPRLTLMVIFPTGQNNCPWTYTVQIFPELPVVLRFFYSFSSFLHTDSGVAS